MNTIKKQHFFGTSILSNGKLLIGGRTKNKLLITIQFSFLNWFGRMPENSRLAPFVPRNTRIWLGSYIYSIKLEINNRCELNCQMCYVPKGNLELPDECKPCTYASVCGRGCRAGNDKLFDSYSTKDFRCKGPFMTPLSKEKVIEHTPCFF